MRQRRGTPAFRLKLAAGRRLGFAGLALSVAACVDSGGGDVRAQNPTAIAVAPEDFLGAVPCINSPGGMQRYVATLFDVTGESFALPSSGAVDCKRTASFGFVVPEHLYVARVDGYDRADIGPLGGPGSGSPIMVDAATGQYVTPRWSTACSGALVAPEPPDAEESTGAEAGAPQNCEAEPDPLVYREGAVTAVRYLTRRVGSCTPLCDRVGRGETGLSVRIDAALGALQCGIGPGQIASFRVQLNGGSELPRSASCGQAVTFTSGLTPGSYSTFGVTAFEGGKAQPTWKTQCFGAPVDGVVLPASCDLLEPIAPPGDF